MIFENISLRLVAFVTGGSALSYISGYNLNHLSFLMPSFTPEHNRELTNHILNSSPYE